jgi:cell division protein FtsI (penicillin-binding protein 3)
LFIAVFCLVTARAFQLQVLGQEEWRRRAERQHQKIIPLPPQRGTIYDSNGEELALSTEVDSIFVEPKKIVDPAQTARSLATALSLPHASILSKVDSGKSFHWLKRQVSPRESALIKGMNLPGVASIREHRRYYPNSEIGAQVVGFTGLDPEGLDGLDLK